MRLASPPLSRMLLLGPAMAALVLAGCSGWEPYEHRNENEEGPKQGMFSGEGGEFVIFRSSKQPKPEDERDESKQDKDG